MESTERVEHQFKDNTASLIHMQFHFFQMPL